MNTTFKKIFAMLVCAVLMLSLVPTLAVSAEETEVTYLQNGLVAWYDGVDNEANGTHNNDATVWQNKVNTTEDWAITLTPDADDHFTDEGFAVHDNRQFFPNNFVDVINGEAWTLEVSLGEFVGLGKSYNTFINCDNDNFSLFIRVDTGCLEFKYAGLTRDHRYELPGGAELINNAVITITYEPGNEMVTYINGEEVDSRYIGDFMGADNLFFGHYKTDRNQDTTFKAIRLYERVLNEHEVAYNYAVATGTATGPYEEPTEAPTEAPTEPETEAPTEEVTTEAPTEEATTEAPTEEATTEAPAEETTAAPAEAPTETEIETNNAPMNGCGSVVGFSAVALMIAAAAAFVCGKRR